MTSYRLLNNVSEYKEAFVDFKAMSLLYDGLKVWFNEDNSSLKDNIKGKWVPVDVKFEASKSAKQAPQVPNLSVWNMSCRS